MYMYVFYRAKDDSIVSVSREKKSLLVTERGQIEMNRKGNSIEMSNGEDLECFETLKEHTSKNKSEIISKNMNM